MTMPDLDAMIAWETGELDDVGTLTLFSNLISTGMAWSLQGTYGRAANAMIKNGVLTLTGEITPKGQEILDDH
jgi:hypothetical protein